jgi:hypothetical protein
VWLRDGRVIDDSFVTTFENTVRNDLWLPSLDRSDLDATLTCEASNSNLTMPVSTSVTIDLHSEFTPPPYPYPHFISYSFREFPFRYTQLGKEKKLGHLNDSPVRREKKNK